MLTPQRTIPRWKEWMPLTTQQLRLRNLIEVHAFNVACCPSRSSSLYFTLHLTSMSPPFYTSERTQLHHPRWAEVEASTLETCTNTSATGVVIRLWRHGEGLNQDQMILVWGLYFSGLVYLGPRLNANASQFKANTIVLHLQGGYFTDSSSLKELPQNAMMRYSSIILLPTDVKPSYTISLLLRLRNIQQAIKRQTQQSKILREKILAGGVSSEDASLSRECNPTLRKLLNRGKPKPQQKQETLAARCQLEVLRFRVALLHQEKLRKVAQVENLLKQRDLAAIDNSDESCKLTTLYQNLHKQTEQLRESRRQFSDMRELFLVKSAQLSFRRKQLMSQLSLIYPVVQADGKYSICGVHLPNSEDLMSADDVSVSVALGFVAHLVQMVSIFLQVPLRYPIIHFGSRSKIIDHITDKIPDKEREFPLFSRGKDKLQFRYGVYLLNKNIAQLRWLVGFPTNDLRATLHNVYHLLHMNQFPTLDSHHRSMSGSSLDVLGSSANVSPVGSMLPTLTFSHGVATSRGRLHVRHRASKSFPGSRRIDISRNMGTDGMFSYSLDKGLDEYEEIKRAEDGISSAHVGSEPNLVRLSSPLSDGRGSTSFFNSTKSEFTMVTERIVQLVDSSNHFDPKSSPDSGNSLGERPIGVEQKIKSKVMFSSVTEGERLSNTSDEAECDGFKSIYGPFNADVCNAQISDSSGDTEVDVGTDALVDFANSTLSERGNVADDSLVESNHRRPGSEETGMECIGVEESVLVDNIFANVTSRTEALASNATSFNLMSSRHGSS